MHCTVLFTGVNLYSLIFSGNTEITKLICSQRKFYPKSPSEIFNEISRESAVCGLNLKSDKFLRMSEGENKASVQHTPAEWISSNQDHYINADKAKYHSEKVHQSLRRVDRYCH